MSSKFTEKHREALKISMSMFIKMSDEDKLKTLHKWSKQVLMTKKELAGYLDATLLDLGNLKETGMSSLSKEDLTRLSFLTIFTPRKAINLILNNPLFKDLDKKNVLDESIFRLTGVKNEYSS